MKKECSGKAVKQSNSRKFRYDCENFAGKFLHSEIFAPLIFVYLMPNDHVLMYYHYSPYVISFFRCFSIFTHLGWLYKPPYKFVTLTFNLSLHTRNFSFCSLLSPLSLIFSATKHSFEDDNSEDVWLDLFLLEEEGHWCRFGGKFSCPLIFHTAFMSI